MCKSHANVVSFDENVSYYVFVDLNELMRERNNFFFFFMKETAIELTGQALAPFYNIAIYFFMARDKTLTPSSCPTPKINNPIANEYYLVFLAARQYN